MQQDRLIKRHSINGILYFIVYVSAILLSFLYSRYLYKYFIWYQIASNIIKAVITQVQFISLIGFITSAITKKRFLIAYLSNIIFFGLILLDILGQKSNFYIPDLIFPFGLHFIIMIIQNHNHAVTKFIEVMEKNRGQLQDMIYLDALTELPNRKRIIEYLNTLCHSSDEEMSPFYIVFIDLDNFKNINDLYGHSVGDKILKHISKLMCDNINSNDMFGRLGGDEFILIIRQILKESDVLQYVNHLRSILTTVVIIKEYQITPSASFGISRYPSDAKEPEKLLRCADTAMYRAKASRRNNIQFFHNN